MITDEIKKFTDDVKEMILQKNPNANVGKTDRIISIGTGAYILFKGVTNLFSYPLLSLTELGIGGSLLYRGVTGYCAIKNAIEDMDEQDQTNTILAQTYPSTVTTL